jgi:hypothetical protein
MRVRVKTSLFERLQEVAEEESERTNDHVTVSDLVRHACMSFLQVRDTVETLENIPAHLFDDDDDFDGEESDFEDDDEDPYEEE